MENTVQPTNPSDSNRGLQQVWFSAQGTFMKSMWNSAMSQQTEVCSKSGFLYDVPSSRACETEQAAKKTLVLAAEVCRRFGLLYF